MSSFYPLPPPHNAVRFSIEPNQYIGAADVTYAGRTEDLEAAGVIEPCMLEGAPSAARGVDAHGSRYWRRSRNGRTQLRRWVCSAEAFRMLPGMSDQPFPAKIRQDDAHHENKPSDAQQRTPYLRLVVNNDEVRP